MLLPTRASSGRPETDLLDTHKRPGARNLFLGVALVELTVVYLLPLVAGAASGWAAASQYFGPIALMTAVSGAEHPGHRPMPPCSGRPVLD